tara:strand:+ start:27 stop:251 length:225 start_codon:yes stop_codon:yes gene_type:complete
MKNGYNIGFVEKHGYTKVYLEPKCKYESHKKKIGYIDDDDTFKCTDSDLMTLEVMEAIVNHWKVYKNDLEKIKS